MHKKVRDLTGQKFNRLTAIKLVGRKNLQTIWECQCDCGNVIQVVSQNLTRGNTKSCGCLYKEHSKKLGELRKLPFGESSFNSLLEDYKYSASHKKLEFSLTREEFRNLTKQNCFYCGINPSNEIKRNKNSTNGIYIYNGIDRIDSSKGYTLENCVTCCTDCNYAKGTKTTEEYLIWLKRSYLHLFT